MEEESFPNPSTHRNLDRRCELGLLRISSRLFRCPRHGPKGTRGPRGRGGGGGRHSSPTVAVPPAGLPPICRASLLSPVVKRAAAANSFPSKEGPESGSPIDPNDNGRTRCPPTEEELNVDWGPVGTEEEDAADGVSPAASASAEDGTFWSELEEEDFPTIDSIVNRAFLRPEEEEEEEEIAVASAAIFEFVSASDEKCRPPQFFSDILHLARQKRLFRFCHRSSRQSYGEGKNSKWGLYLPRTPPKCPWRPD